MSNCCIRCLINDLAADNSRLAKEKILRNFEDQTLARRVFALTYNPYNVYYVRKFPEVTWKGSTKFKLNDLLNVLEQSIQTRYFTGNAALELLAYHAEETHPDDVWVFRKILERDLDCGVSSNTVNKIWPNTIPSYPVLLAASDKPENRANIKFPCIAEVKYDGLRVNAHVDINDKTVKYISRNGRPIDINNTTLDTEFVKLATLYRQNMVFDGEMICVRDGKILDRKTGNGIGNKAVRGTISDAEKEMAKIVVWDAVPAQNFITGKYSVTMVERESSLKINMYAAAPTRIIKAEGKLLGTWEEVQAYYNEQYAAGEEGLIVKNIFGIWEDKRSKDLVKMKAELTAELKVVGVQEGSGKYTGMIGGLVCESEGDDPVRVTVGSGLTDFDRSLPADAYIGKIVSVKYNEIIKSKNEGSSRNMFLPIFLEIREDKTVADVL